MEITSNTGKYVVEFNALSIKNIHTIVDHNDFLIIDKVVANLYEDQLAQLLIQKNTYILDANESSKSFESLGVIYQHLLKNNVRKQSRLIAIGGGVTQDISCFIASTIYRGIDWIFIPTTLLSQCDSCIGSKSSINLNTAKNVIGNFYPPKKIYVLPQFLDTLANREVKSGVGEIFKVSIIDSVDAFIKLGNDYEQLFENKDLLLEYIKYALDVKKAYIQVDEFDRGIRNIFNYGHSFGHAIESVTSFLIPHGIAVTMGIDIANYLAYKMGHIDGALLKSMHKILRKNYLEFIGLLPSACAIIDALSVDKKNTADSFVFIMLGKELKLNKVEMANNHDFLNTLGEALKFIENE